LLGKEMIVVPDADDVDVAREMMFRGPEHRKVVLARATEF